MPESAPNLTRFRATIQYDGTAFHGSQLQPEVRTVQGEIETALSRLLDTPTRVDFAGRTDTGVHATAQEIAFAAPAGWGPSDLARGMSALTPQDIAIAAPVSAPDGFHPRFDAERRRYRYIVAPGRSGSTPFLRAYTWQTAVAGGLDLPGGAESLSRLAGLAARLPGERDFAGFAKAGQPERGSVCAIESAEWRPDAGGRFTFEVIADRFLHHMVRYMVGTMLEIAAGSRPPEDLSAILDARPPSRPVFPAPPTGLYLTGVRYAGEWNRAEAAPW